MLRPEATSSDGAAPIAAFRDEWFFLSNFSPATVTFGGLAYPTVEHAYQAARCARAVGREVVRRARAPGEAKRLGRAFEQVDDWRDIREGLMLDLLRQKFSLPELRERLLATGTRPLIENNDWGDTYWGQVDGIGENRLGRLLEAVRHELRSAPPPDESAGHDRTR